MTPRPSLRSNLFRYGLSAALFMFSAFPLTAVDPAIQVIGSGDVGVGTTTPTASLHVTRSDGTAQLLVQETNSNPVYRNPLKIDGAGLQTVMLLNNSDPLGWEFAVKGAPTSRFEINKLGSANPFQFLSNGNLTISGVLFTGGGSCGGGCDYVFQPGYELESIDQHAAFMWDNGYLKGLGPTPEGAPSINLSEKVGGLINELEKAHIYIERLHDQAKDKDKQIAELHQRIARIELLVSASTSAGAE